LESWKQYDEAIKIYRNMLAANENDFQAWRNLALTYYQKGDYQQAVDIFYRAITKAQDNNGYYNNTTRAMMLQEMNAVIAIHKERLDLSKINQQLIRPLEVDLRVTLDCNNRDLFSNVLIMEPDGTTCSYLKPESVNGGKLTRDDNYYRGYYSDAPEEYQIKKAQDGKYKIKLNYSDYRGYYYDVKVPTVVKITLFKNFGNPNQSMVIENVIMDNQNGEIEIGEVIW